MPRQTKCDKMCEDLMDALANTAGGAYVITGATHQRLLELLGMEHTNANRMMMGKVLSTLEEDGIIALTPSPDDKRVSDIIMVDNVRRVTVPMSSGEITHKMATIKAYLSQVAPTAVSMDMPASVMIHKLVGENRFLWGFVKRVMSVVDPDWSIVDGTKED